MLLNQDQLTQLARRYESELKQALKAPSHEYSFNTKALSACVALGAVAEALKDPKLYERATLISSPKPNDLQKKSIIEMYLKFNQTDEALNWLNTPWLARFETDRLSLLDQAYQQNGQVEELIKTRYLTYCNDQQHVSFMRYFELLNDEEKQQARLDAIQTAERGGELLDNIDLLLKIGEPVRAQALVLANVEQINDAFYSSLLKIAKQLEAHQCWLAATACYRSLLWDILNAARTKAYTHAAKYYKKLALMLNDIHEFKPLVEHAVFIEQLKQKHGLKRSFWDRVL